MIFKSLIERINSILKITFKFLKSKLKKEDYATVKSNKLHLLFEVEQPFNDLYEKGMQLSDTPEGGIKRRARFYNLISLLKAVKHLEGEIVECGCWKGLSSYLMCNYLRQMDSSFDGASYHIIDSFEGLSEPTPKDFIKRSLIDEKGDRKGSYFKKGGAYSSQLEVVTEVLNEFPGIKFNQGWIPECLNGMPDMRVRFLHIDVDLYEPTIGALNYFHPKMVPGGIIVCDDYGSLYWPGAQMAVEEFSEKNNLNFISLSSGQVVFIKQ